MRLLYLPVLLALLRLVDPRWSGCDPSCPCARCSPAGSRRPGNHRCCGGTLWLTILFNLFAWPVLSMVPVIGREQLQLDPQGVGVLASLDGIGSLVGALLLSTAASRLRQGPVYLGAVVGFLLLQMVLAWSTGGRGDRLTLLALGLSCRPASR
jgi:hypothetical protein